MNTVLITKGHTLVADTRADEFGELSSGVPMRRGLLVTVIGGDGSAVRQSLDSTAPGDVIRGPKDVPTSEFPAGIAGQVWDATANTPVTRGVVTLSRNRVTLATRELDSRGWFAFELTRALPLTPGRYLITTTAAGFRAHRTNLVISGTATSWRLDRIDLTARAS